MRPREDSVPSRAVTTRRLLVVCFTLIAAISAACGAVAPSAVPSGLQNRTPSAAPTVASSASSSSGDVAATLTLGTTGIGNVDGPGNSVSEAIANRPVGPQLVNGSLLRKADGTIWLCELLLTSAPPDCADPRLLVQNWASDDQTLVTGVGLHILDGFRWVEHVQLFGVVRAPEATDASASPASSAPSDAPAEPTAFVPPSPACPSPSAAVTVPSVIASIGAGAGIFVRPYTSTFATCTTTAVADGVPTLPANGLIAHPGTALTLALPSGWRYLRWEGGDGPVVGDAANVMVPVDTPERPQWIAVPVPIRPGDSRVGLTLWVISTDARVVGQMDVIVRINVR